MWLKRPRIDDQRDDRVSQSHRQPCSTPCAFAPAAVQAAQSVDVHTPDTNAAIDTSPEGVRVEISA